MRASTTKWRRGKRAAREAEEPHRAEERSFFMAPEVAPLRAEVLLRASN